MIGGLLWLLGCQLVGEVAVRLLDVPVPGPVVGLVVLLGVLRWQRPGADAGVVRTGDALLAHLQLLFVPAGVGVVAYAALLREDAVPLVVALVGSWLLGLVAVALVLERAARRRASR